MHEIYAEDVDLLGLASALADRLGRQFQSTYLDGKELLRDAVLELLGCSAYAAEQMVETLEAHGFVRFPHLVDQTHPLGEGYWRIEAKFVS